MNSVKVAWLSAKSWGLVGSRCCRQGLLHRRPCRMRGLKLEKYKDLGEIFPLIVTHFLFYRWLLLLTRLSETIVRNRIWWDSYHPETLSWMCCILWHNISSGVWRRPATGVSYDSANTLMPCCSPERRKSSVDRWLYRRTHGSGTLLSLKCFDHLKNPDINTNDHGENPTFHSVWNILPLNTSTDCI
jgi:hypothetical protein